MKKTALIVCPVFSVFLLKAQVTLEENQKLKEANGTLWYANPWIWIAGVALFLLIFILVLRKSTRNKTKT
ncbi:MULTISPECIES: hypothetical protein [Sphingobacterium]|jgi:hypothetical protein|uniref:Uncharacterized protein n=2 Tax=Sphingobacterium TaxID=28453 RepID=A0ACD5C3M9_9SPHI|nr:MULTISPECIES: hypothetical protein [Sphingobacterium]HAE66427.1 hypothetical protein [Sphingobacterium sp.]KKO91531.1 hypothetical protein AAW12_09170 [Sphingobacterium sp. Ag1]OFV17060.1 hypothetical protein HMPREF3127_09340 [Sphingobacterium sp. HMSC13C05]OJZ07989.1 MAG: hypothetical protein BGP15_08770 [Sphingobacterium sp. 40-24]QQT45825.1 hypothetical protein I6J00_03875 [Sphingobacterium multivorum]